MTHDRATNSQRTPDARDIVWPAGDAPLNEPLTPDPTGADSPPPTLSARAEFASD